MIFNLKNSSLIMEQIAKGNEKAIRLVIDAYLNKVLNLSYRIVYSSDDAEEISQEVFLKLFQQSKNWFHKASLATWLYRVTINVSINWKKKRKNHLSLEHFDGVNKEDFSEVLFHQVVDRKKLEKAMFELKENQRIALTLFYFDDLSLKEAAVIMEKTEDAYESLLRRSRSKLKTILGGREGVEKTELKATTKPENLVPNHEFLAKSKEVIL